MWERVDAIAFWLIGFTVDTDKTYVHSDGNTYPYVTLDVPSASHPVYTGQERKAKNESRGRPLQQALRRFRLQMKNAAFRSPRKAALLFKLDAA